MYVCILIRFSHPESATDDANNTNNSKQERALHIVGFNKDKKTSMGLLHIYTEQQKFVFSPSQRQVKKSQELSQRGLIHDIHHTHFCDQEVQDTAPGGH